MPQTVWVRDCDLHRVLIETALKGKWNLLGSYLDQIERDPRVRGVPLLRALNTPLSEQGMTLPAVLISRAAPLPLIQRVLDLGAATGGRFSMKDSSGRVLDQCSLMHIATLSGRPDLVSSLPLVKDKNALENSRGESPVRTLARLGSDSWLERKETQSAAGIAARRYLALGGSNVEMSRTVSMLLSRSAWALAEHVIDSWTVSSSGSVSVEVKGSDICKWAWFGVLKDAPASLFSSLRELATNARLTNAINLNGEISTDLLFRCVPKRAAEAPMETHDWSALLSRLEKLEDVRGLIPDERLREVINACETSMIFERVDEELDMLGLVEPVDQAHPLTVFQLMVYGGAPEAGIRRALALGADTTYSAWVGTSKHVFADGMALHLAVARGDATIAQAIIEGGAPLFQRNGAGESEMQHLFSLHRNVVPPERIPMIETLLRATHLGDDETVWTKWGAFDGQVAGYPFSQLLMLAEKIGDKAKVEVAPPVLPELKERTFQVVDGLGSLTDVNYQQLGRLVEREYAKRFKGASVYSREEDGLYRMSLARLEQDSTARSIAERIAWALAHPFEQVQSPSAATQDGETDAPSGHDNDPQSRDFSGEIEGKETETDLEMRGEFLSFPEFGDVEHGFTYQDPESEDEPYTAYGDDGEAPLTELFGQENSNPDLQILTDEVTRDADPGSGEPIKKEESLLEMLGLAESDFEPDTGEPVEKSAEDTAFDALVEMDELTLAGEIADELALLVEAGELSPSSISAAYGFRSSSLSSAVKRSVREGQIYEAYLLLKTLDEIRASKPSELSAFSRSLQSLLYRFPVSVAAALVQRVDGAYSNHEGYHPYMAEFLCLLRHPLDKLRSPETLGGLTLGVTGVAQLMRHGRLSAPLVDAWGQIGTWNFSFPVWRFDSQSVRTVTGQRDAPSLMELAGMLKVSNPVDEFRINPNTREREHLLGSMFMVKRGTPFHDSFDQDTAQALGFQRLDRDTAAVFRRACIIINHPYRGTLVLRNSSHNFGRDRFDHPGLWKPGGLNEKELLNLSWEKINKEFVSVVGNKFFDPRGFNRVNYGRSNDPGTGRMTLDQAGTMLQFMMGQATTIRAAHARMKFDANVSTAWASDGVMVGGYRSPLFRHVVDLLEDRMAVRASDGKTIVPDLAFANPDFFPAPHARLSVTKNALEVLSLLVQGKESQVSERQLKTSGVRDFLDTAFRRGRNSELLLLPPEEQLQRV